MALTRRSLRLLNALRAEVGRIADEAAARIGDSWASAWQQTSPSWQSAADVLAGAQRWPSSWQIARIPQVATAVMRSRQAVGQAAVASERHAMRAAEQAITATLKAEPGIVAAQLRRAAAADFAQGITQARTDRLADQARRRIRSATGSLGDDIARGVERVLVSRPAQVDAASITGRIQLVFQQGPQRAVATAQTQTVDASRAASAYVGEVNSTAVAGWMWRSSASRTTCPACWSKHGTIHPLRTPGPQGHTSCRCSRMLLARDPDGHVRPPDAQAEFRTLSRADQLAVMGPARLQLLDDSAIAWADLAELKAHPGWRSAYVARTVADLQRIAGQRT